MAKKKKNSFNSLYIFPVLFVIICVSYVLRFFLYNIDTEILSYGEMENTISCKAVAIRSEWVTPLPANTKMNYRASEGDKVPFGKPLVEIVKGTGADENLAAKIKELDDRIAEMKKNNVDNNFFSGDKEKLNDRIEELTAKIKAASKSGNVDEMNQAKKELDAMLYKKSMIDGQGSFYGKSLEQLQNERTTLQNMYKQSMDVIYSQYAGVVSYTLDGFEQVLNPANLDKIKLSEIKELITMIDEKKNSKKAEQSGIKVVDNFNWYLAAVLDESQLSGLKQNKWVSIRFKNMGDTMVDGRIINIGKAENNQVLLTIKIDEYVKDFYKLRLSDIDIIKDHYEGMKVSSKALVKKDGKTGLYIIRSCMVHFVPVVVVSTEGDTTLVDNINPKDAKEANPMTLKVFDEIVTTVNKVKENQVILGNV